MIKFLEVYIKNFNSIEDLRLPFSVGKHLVTGPNGSGKSSIWEAIVWTLFKRAMRDKDPSRDYKGDCVTGVKFEKSGVLYEVIRYYRDKSKGSTLELYIDGELSSHRKTASTETEVQSLLSIQPDIFLSTILVLQGLPVNFSAMTPTVRKLILEGMRGFQQWDEFKDLFQARYKQTAMEKATADSAAQDVRNSVTRLQARVETLTQVREQATGDLDTQIVERKQKARTLDALLHQERDKYAALLGDKDYALLVKQVSDMQQTRAVVSSRLSSLAQTIQQRVCTQCHQEYPKERIEKAEQEVAALTDKLKNIDNLIAEEQVTVESVTALRRSMQEAQFQLNSAQVELERLAERRFQPIEDTKPLELELEQLHSKHFEAQAVVDSVDSSAENLKYIHDQLLPSSQFRATALEKHLEFINKAIASVVPLIFDDLVVKLVLDSKKQGIDMEVVRRGKGLEYKSLSGGERRRVDITLVLAFQRFLMQSSGIASNLLVFDEIFDGLDKDGVERVLMSIESLFPESSAVYVVTHSNAIKSSFASLIRVTKENDITKVDYEQTYE